MSKSLKSLCTVCLMITPFMMDAQIFIMEKYSTKISAFDGNDVFFENGEKKNICNNYSDQIIVITRHGEKADQTKDTDLSAEGHLRASRLSQILKKSPVFDMVFTSDYTRTINTIKPYCLSKNINWQLYDPRQQDELIEKFKNHHLLLVSGHSNTIPLLINKLTGTGLAEFDERDYSNLIFIKIPQQGPKTIYFFNY